MASVARGCSCSSKGKWPDPGKGSPTGSRSRLLLSSAKLSRPVPPRPVHPVWWSPLRRSVSPLPAHWNEDNLGESAAAALSTLSPLCCCCCCCRSLCCQSLLRALAAVRRPPTGEGDGGGLGHSGLWLEDGHGGRPWRKLAGGEIGDGGVVGGLASPASRRERFQQAALPSPFRCTAAFPFYLPAFACRSSQAAARSDSVAAVAAAESRSSSDSSSPSHSRLPVSGDKSGNETSNVEGGTSPSSLVYVPCCRQSRLGQLPALLDRGCPGAGAVLGGRGVSLTLPVCVAPRGTRGWPGLPTVLPSCLPSPNGLPKPAGGMGPSMGPKGVPAREASPSRGEESQDSTALSTDGMAGCGGPRRLDRSPRSLSAIISPSGDYGVGTTRTRRQSRGSIGLYCARRRGPGAAGGPNRSWCGLFLK